MDRTLRRVGSPKAKAPRGPLHPQLPCTHTHSRRPQDQRLSFFQNEASPSEQPPWADEACRDPHSHGGRGWGVFAVQGSSRTGLRCQLPVNPLARPSPCMGPGSQAGGSALHPKTTQWGLCLQPAAQTSLCWEGPVGPHSTGRGVGGSDGGAGGHLAGVCSWAGESLQATLGPLKTQKTPRS